MTKVSYIAQVLDERKTISLIKACPLSFFISVTAVTGIQIRCLSATELSPSRYFIYFRTSLISIVASPYTAYSLVTIYGFSLLSKNSIAAFRFCPMSMLCFTFLKIKIMNILKIYITLA